MMNGQNSARHRCTDYIFPWKNNREIDYPLAASQQVPPEWNWGGLKESDVTLPNLFRKAGFQTIHVGKAHFAPKDREGENPLNLVLMSMWRVPVLVLPVPTMEREVLVWVAKPACPARAAFGKIPWSEYFSHRGPHP